MSEPQSGRYDGIARRWLALIERRQEHFLDLCDSGRWRHYFTEAEFLDEMRKVLRVRDQWAAIAGVPLNSEDLLPDGGLPPPLANGVAAPAWPD
ncbi:MAG: TIGR03809 family protein [Xanthobacteraceae bacterium]